MGGIEPVLMTLADALHSFKQDADLVQNSVPAKVQNLHALHAAGSC
jgi:hypothetical protein